MPAPGHSPAQLGPPGKCPPNLLIAGEAKGAGHRALRLMSRASVCRQTPKRMPEIAGRNA